MSHSNKISHVIKSQDEHYVKVFRFQFNLNEVSLLTEKQTVAIIMLLSTVTTFLWDFLKNLA